MKLARALILAVCAAPAAAQEGTVDLLDGETLYDGGWLITIAHDYQRRASLLRGSDEISDPLDQSEIEQTTSVAAHWGFRHDVQLSAIVPYVTRSLSQDGAPDSDASGLGDASLIAKWRFHRWDAPHKALNVALIGGLKLPSGSDDEKDNGATLAPDLQPGTGSWDPIVGVGATYEPGRWRFNALALMRFNTENGDDYRFGNRFDAEIEAGNRFWLEPYPGPFMRADARLRYTSEGRDEQDRSIVSDTGSERLTAGANLAFRPRPSLDFQIGVDVPLYEHVEGTQLAHDLALTFTFGYRF